MSSCDQVVIITGGSQGLGECLVRRFIQYGANVVFCARHSKDLLALEREISPLLCKNQQIMALPVDISSPEQVDFLIESTLNKFSKIDVLINNAGVYGPLGNLEDVSWEEWVQAININLLGLIYTCRAVLPFFKARNRGKIINMSGGGATQPLPKLSAYAVSKVGVVRFTETLSKELLNYNIYVNAIAPGVLNTRLLDQVLSAGPEKVGEDFYKRMFKVKQSGTSAPLDLTADLLIYLAFEDKSGITGKLISTLWDPWRNFAKYSGFLSDTDIYTLRRIIPSDRGMDWDTSK